MEKVYVVVLERDHDVQLGAYHKQSNADAFCDEYFWCWYDENDFCWALEVIEDDADNWAHCCDDDQFDSRCYQSTEEQEVWYDEFAVAIM